MIKKGRFKLTHTYHYEGPDWSRVTEGDVLIDTAYPLPKRNILLGCRGLVKVRPDALGEWQEGYELACHAYAQGKEDNDMFPGCHDGWDFEIVDDGEIYGFCRELDQRLAIVNIREVIANEIQTSTRGQRDLL